MSEDTSRILRVPVLDQNTGERNGQTIVAKAILQKGFQLELTATDSNNVFHIKCKKAELIAAKDKKNKATEEEWQSTIAWAMCGIRPAIDIDLSAVELEALLKREKQITFVVSKNLGEVTQRLGTIIAPCNDEIEIDLFVWAQEAASARDDAESTISELVREKDALKGTIKGLNGRLDTFAHEKKEHEDLMLERFRQLLNTKKLKIRDQQRLLKQAKLGKATASDVEAAAADSDDEHSIRDSRKRKASGRVKVETAEEDVEMDAPESDDSESLGRKQPQATPDRSEDEQETEDEDEDVTQGQQYRTSTGAHGHTNLSAADAQRGSTQLPVQTRAEKTQAQHRDAEIDGGQTDDDEEL